jgi:tetratricopeptide (TPR) repeat protein
MASSFRAPIIQTLALGVLSAACQAALSAPAARADSDDTVGAGLVAGKAAHEPRLVDFSALWCHACWWMKTNVMKGPQWNALLRRVVYVDSDTDLADGAQWMEKLHVPGLPTYVVMDSDGNELGRIVGEAKAEEFYPKLAHMVGGADTLDSIKAKALKGNPDDVAKVLEAFGARNDREAALDWYQSLPNALQANAYQYPKVVLNLESMRMDEDKHKLTGEKNEAAKEKYAKSCITHGQRALAASPEYDDLVQLIDGLSDCSDGMDSKQRHDILDSSLTKATGLLDAEKLSKRPLPPGTREAVIYVAETYRSLGDQPARAAIYQRGISAYRKQMDEGHGGLDLKKDRSAADDLYALYRFSEQTDQVRSLLKQLAESYGDDCNYALAYGALLVKENHADQALPYLERAAYSAHGRYVLRVATQRAKALISLSRRSEAEKVAAEALRASGPNFPKDQEVLKRTVGAQAESATKAGVSSS